MARRYKDSKFVIYQVLYIFVITVLAIKGANLDLSAVISKEKAVSRNVRDSLMVVIDSLSSLGLKFDVKVDTAKLKTENQLLKTQISRLNENIASLKKIETTPKPKEKAPEPFPTKIETTPALSAMPISQTQKFIQNTWNIAKNNGNIPVEIINPKNKMIIVSVLPGEEKKFDLDNQEEIIARYGNQNQVLKVDKRKPPEIRIESVSSKMNGRKIYVEDLQRTTTYKVTILDERPDQINVSYSGPISVSGPFKVNDDQLVYNVSLKIAPNEQSFNEWIDKNNPLRESDGRYKVNFFMIASDKRTKNKVQAGESFYFTDYAR